jgi:hypothetical protein
MEVKHLFWSAGLAFATFGHNALATSYDTASKDQLLAPTVVQASCDYQSGSSVCDGGCDSSCGKGLVSRGSIFKNLFGQSACDAGKCDSACGCGIGSGCGCGIGCDASGCSSCGENGCDSFGGSDRGLLGYGLIKHSDTCFNDFISPMTNPVFFEDPRTLSEVRFIFLHHNLPAALGGHSAQAYAMQVRAALTKRLSVIATKDGFVYSQSPLLEPGYLDIAAGLKYNLYRDAYNGRLLSVGMTFEAPTGSKKSLQGNGNGEFHFFTTGGTRIGEKSHWISATGLREPADTTLENRMWYWSNHFDRQIGDRPLYAFTEINWYHYSKDGTAFPAPVHGGDIFNLGSTGVAGDNLVTQAIGLKAKPRSNQEVGVAYEFPLSPLEGLMRNRLTADWIIRY